MKKFYKYSITVRKRQFFDKKQQLINIKFIARQNLTKITNLCQVAAHHALPVLRVKPWVALDCV